MRLDRPAPPADRPTQGGTRRSFVAPWRSLLWRSLALAAAFAALTLHLWQDIAAGASSRRDSLRDHRLAQARLSAEALWLLLGQTGEARVSEAGRLLQNLPGDGARRLLLLRPAGMPAGPRSFFLIGADPPVPEADLERERRKLLGEGVLDGLASGCGGGAWSQGADGGLSASNSFASPAGCWILVAAHPPPLLDAEAAELAQALAAPPVATAGYAALALLGMGWLAGGWWRLRRFDRSVRHGTMPAGPPPPELRATAEICGRTARLVAQARRGMRSATAEAGTVVAAAADAARRPLEEVRLVVPVEAEHGQRAFGALEATLTEIAVIGAALGRMGEVEALLLAPLTSRLDLAAAVESAVAARRPAAGARGVRLESGATAPGLVTAVPQLLEAAVDGLIDHAVANSPRGGRVAVAVSHADGRVRLEVADEGPPAPANVAALFTPAPAGEGRAGDVGLWTAHRLARAAGGSLSARSGERGLTLALILPAA